MNSEPGVEPIGRVALRTLFLSAVLPTIVLSGLEVIRFLPAPWDVPLSVTVIAAGGVAAWWVHRRLFTPLDAHPR